MSFLDDVLQFDRARGEGRVAPAPAGGARPVVCVTCPELASDPAGRGVAGWFGLPADQVVVVALPGARVPRSDGDVARAVALAAGAVGGTLGGTDVVVLGHEGCAFRSPSFSVPGPSQQGESFSSIAELVRHAAGQLRASAWMARTNVHGAFVNASGRLEAVAADTARAAAPAGGGYVPGPVASGPVSFFGAPGAAPSLTAPPPSIPAPTAGSLGGLAGPAAMSAPGAVRWDTPQPLAAPSAPMQMPGALQAPTPSSLPAALTEHVGLVMPVSAQMPTVGPMPTIGELASAGVMTGTSPDALVSGPPPKPSRGFDAPPPPPPPRPAPPQHDRGRHSDRGSRVQPPPVPREPPPPAAASDDPFKRAEEILERLRNERRR